MTLNFHVSLSFSNPKENTAEINANGTHWPVEKLFFKSPLVGPEWDEGCIYRHLSLEAGSNAPPSKATQADHQELHHDRSRGAGPGVF